MAEKLTKKDIEKIEAEIEHRKLVLRKEVIEAVKAQVRECFNFDEILETVAGSVVTSHCGKDTVGVLFIAE